MAFGKFEGLIDSERVQQREPAPARTSFDVDFASLKSIAAGI